MNSHLIVMMNCNRILFTGCQVLLWKKPIKSRSNQSVQLYTETSLEIRIDYGPENMLQYVANLHKDLSVIQIMSCDKLHHAVIQRFLSRDKEVLSYDTSVL